MPGSSVHGISQARVLHWVAISFSRGSSRSRHGSHMWINPCALFNEMNSHGSAPCRLTNEAPELWLLWPYTHTPALSTLGWPWGSQMDGAPKWQNSLPGLKACSGGLFFFFLFYSSVFALYHVRDRGVIAKHLPFTHFNLLSSAATMTTEQKQGGKRT